MVSYHVKKNTLSGLHIRPRSVRLSIHTRHLNISLRSKREFIGCVRSQRLTSNSYRNEGIRLYNFWRPSETQFAWMRVVYVHLQKCFFLARQRVHPSMVDMNWESFGGCFNGGGVQSLLKIYNCLKTCTDSHCEKTWHVFLLLQRGNGSPVDSQKKRFTEPRHQKAVTYVSISSSSSCCWLFLEASPNSAFLWEHDAYESNEQSKTTAKESWTCKHQRRAEIQLPLSWLHGSACCMHGLKFLGQALDGLLWGSVDEWKSRVFPVSMTTTQCPAAKPCWGSKWACGQTGRELSWL